jgi:dihydroxyacetone kinase-like protein
MAEVVPSGLAKRFDDNVAAAPMDFRTIAALIDAVAAAVVSHADELTALDQAIGDGDHGLNMKRGCEAVLAQRDAIASRPLPDALKSIGTTLVMTVGGASGPLYGTLFMALAKELPPSPSRADFARAADVAIAAVKARGKSDFGQKTMLDVLKPASEAFAAGRDPVAAANAAAQATIPMKALRGRASFLGDRSIGHMDPGARSSALMIAALCERLEPI